MNTPLDDSDRLFAALKELPSRPARLLELRFVDRKTDAEVAAFYGMPKDAYAVHLLRAARLLTEAYMPVWGKAERTVPYDSELAEAQSFVQAANDTGSPPQEVASPVRAVRHLWNNSEALRRKIDQAAAVEAASPAARRETWIRRALVVVLLAVTAALYLMRNR